MRVQKMPSHAVIYNIYAATADEPARRKLLESGTIAAPA